MTPTERIQVMRERIEAKFLPTLLEIKDDSHKHVGHAGAAGGAGHYTVIIEATAFKNKSRIDAHREIYSVLADLMPDEIHALSIKLK